MSFNLTEITNQKINVEFQKRNEIATFKTDTIAAESFKAVISRFNKLENYSAIVVAISLDKNISFRVENYWYMKTGEENGTIVFVDPIITKSGREYSTTYLELRGNELSVLVRNDSEEEVSATVFVMGIR